MQAVTFNAIVALIIWDVLMLTFLTSNCGSWASFLSHSGPLSISPYSVFCAAIQSIILNKFGCIYVSSYAGCRKPNVALVLLFQETIVSSVSPPNVVCNDYSDMLSSKSWSIVYWPLSQNPFEWSCFLLVIQSYYWFISWLFSCLSWIR